MSKRRNNVMTPVEWRRVERRFVHEAAQMQSRRKSELTEMEYKFISLMRRKALNARRLKYRDRPTWPNAMYPGKKGFKVGDVYVTDGSLDDVIGELWELWRSLVGEGKASSSLHTAN